MSDVSAGIEVVRSAIRGVMSLPLTVILSGHWHRGLQGHTTDLGTALCVPFATSQPVMMAVSF